MPDEAELRPDLRLPSGRHGLSREFVVSSQRDRILDAVGWAVARKGYGAVTVADVLARAQVSRTTYYEQFRDKEDGFLAAFDAIAEQFLQTTLLDPVLSSLEWAERSEMTLDRMLRFFASEPDFARMCMVESLGAGEAAWERYRTAIELIADDLHEAAAAAGLAEGVPDGASRAAVSGIAAVIREEILAGRLPQLPDLLGDLVYSVVVPYVGIDVALERRAVAEEHLAGSVEAGEAATAPPGVDPVAPAEVVAPQHPQPEPGSPRERLLHAMLQSLGERGYARTSVADVTRIARTSRTTFYAEFANKEECFLAAHDLLVGRLRAHVAEAYDPALAWPERVVGGLQALASTVAGYPSLARSLVLEAVAAGPAGHARLRGAVETFVPFLVDGLEILPHGTRLPPTVARVAVGSVAGIVLTEVAAGRGGSLPEAVPALVHAALVQVLGPEEAARHAMAAAAS